MNLKQSFHHISRLTATLPMLLAAGPAWAQSADAGAVYDAEHIVAYIVATLLISVFVLTFYNRLFVFREQEVNAQNRSLNARLALVLQSGKVRVWTYDVATRHYRLLDENGQPGEEYNPVTFSQKFDRDDFELLRSAVFDLCDERRTSATVSLRGSQPATAGEPQSHYDVHVTVSQYSDRGKPVTVLGIQRDVTEEHQKQEKVNQMMMRYHTVFNSSLIDMVYYDKDGILTDVNDKACETFNITDRSQLLNGTYRLADNPLFNGIDIAHMEQMRTTAVTDFDAPTEANSRIGHLGIRGKMYYESSINPVRNAQGELEGIYMVGRNITEMVDSFHRQQEGMHQLQKATESIQGYIDNINYALHVSDVRLMNYYPDTHTLTLSNNLNQPQIKLSQLRCIRIAAPRERRHASSLLNRLDHRIDRPFEDTLETVLHDKQGRNIFLRFSVVPMYDAEGRVSHYFGMCRNQTEMIETERRLQAETRKAQETELLKQSFLTNMSYEIRTPLNTVVGFAELFEADHDPADEPVFVEEIKKNSNSLLELINDILFLSRLDANMIEYTKADTDFALVFESHCQMGWSSISPNVKTIVENPYNHLVVNIDQANLGQVIQKLCANAAYYTHDGYVRAKYEYRRGVLTIVIEDTGEGIDEETLSKVFERFVHNQKDEQCGTGLGLPIVQALVEQMGGTIDIQSELGKGTTAWVSIPCEHGKMDKKREIPV